MEMRAKGSAPCGVAGNEDRLNRSEQKPDRGALLPPAAEGFSVTHRRSPSGATLAPDRRRFQAPKARTGARDEQRHLLRC